MNTHSIECFSMESILCFFQVAFQGGNTFVLWKLSFFQGCQGWENAVPRLRLIKPEKIKGLDISMFFCSSASFLRCSYTYQKGFGPKTETSCDSHLCAWNCLHATPLNDDDCGYKHLQTDNVHLIVFKRVNELLVNRSLVAEILLEFQFSCFSTSRLLRSSSCLRTKMPTLQFLRLRSSLSFCLKIQDPHEVTPQPLLPSDQNHQFSSKKNPKKPWNFPETITKNRRWWNAPPLAFLFCLQGFLFPLSFHGLGEAALKFTVWSNLWVDFWGQFIIKRLK